MYNLNWSRKELTSQKLGTFGEYYAKMALTSYGMNVYTSEVDDHGIDFVAETRERFLKFQVKTIRKGTGYVCMLKEHFNIEDDSLFVLLLYLEDGEHPVIYVIPTAAWKNEMNGVFVYRSYEGKKSKPEYGINTSQKNMSQLEIYKLERMIDMIV